MKASRRPPVVVAGVIAGFVAVLLAGCGEDKGQHGSQPAGESETATESDGTQVLTVSAGDDLKFAQTSLSAHTGQVKIVFKVTGKVPHNLAFTSGSQASTGTVNDATTSLTATFSTPGVYQYICTIHPYMKGTLTVS